MSEIEAEEDEGECGLFSSDASEGENFDEKVRQRSGIDVDDSDANCPSQSAQMKLLRIVEHSLLKEWRFRKDTTLYDVGCKSQIIWDPQPTKTVVLEDEEWVNEWYDLPGEDQNAPQLSAWLLRLQISQPHRAAVFYERLLSDFCGGLDCIFYDERPVLRLRLNKEKFRFASFFHSLTLRRVKSSMPADAVQAIEAYIGRP
eukprot:gnl/TRDRNA2_/TRDRNA2_134917_c0_seq1.p1 gnl/TRDRNA2_/TRDRNA2_134917_c0~~gnl/TRDRNA2_/TRDRNA2_134917_c0_seq1.p1  ORF type:complete len:201 (-),score=38.31 gnl/TRDRNA2_/TRDRNA2_134917_c0_seq1:478-1080(-)